MGLGDGQGFAEKFQVFISLMELITTFFSPCQENFGSIFANTEF